MKTFNEKDWLEYRTAHPETGTVFNELTFIKMTGKVLPKRGKTALFKCSCGVVKELLLTKVKTKKTPIRSCGCIIHKPEHGKITHNMRYTRQYSIWRNMKARCSNKKDVCFAMYGGAGVSVCDKWKQFSGFWEDMKEEYTDELTIDRIDGTKGYSLENCRWATIIEQNNNKRTNRILTVGGIERTIAQWSRHNDVPQGTISSRLKKSLSHKKAVTNKNHEKI